MLYQRKTNKVEAIQVNNKEDALALLKMISEYIADFTIKIYRISDAGEWTDFEIDFTDFIKGKQKMSKGEWITIEDISSNYINSKLLTVYSEDEFEKMYEEVKE